MVATMPTPGSLLRRRLLGTDAVYRVLEDGDVTVLVEVVQAPGLAPGFQMRVTAADARALERQDAPDLADHAAAAVPRGRFRRSASL
jgi:hypothetical protein